MNTYKIYTLAAVALLILGGAMSSCNDDLQLTDNKVGAVSDGFTLEVNSRQDNGTRVELQSNNLDLIWELGDVLTMVNQQTNDYITLTATTLDPNDPTRATFTSQYGVPAGTYWVLYNIDKDNKQLLNTQLLHRDKINESDCLKMYDIITIATGQTTANVNMKHVYAKISLDLKNVPTEFHDNYCTIGMIAPKSGFYKQGELRSNGVEYDKYVIVNGSMYPNKWERQFLTGDYMMYDIYQNSFTYQGSQNLSYDYSTNQTITSSDFSAFVLPSDLTNDEVYCYFYYYDYSDPMVSKRVFYELKKPGLKLESGKNYTLTFDFNQANRIETSNDESLNVESAEQLRAAKYCMANRVNITSDFDCGTEPVFPLDANQVNGNGHTIANLNIDWGYDGAGFVGFRNDNIRVQIYDLKLQGATISGQDYVGGFYADYPLGYNMGTKYCNLSKCELLGTTAKRSTIKGNNYVGGLAAVTALFKSELDNITSIANSYTDDNCEIIGISNVGGLVGGLGTFAPDVNYMGGYYSVSNLAMVNNSGNKATVTATGDNVGGVVGRIYGNLASNKNRLELCYNTGTVTGVNNVGGIAGCITEEMAYALGSTSENAVVYQCFNEGNVTATENKAGGIVGESGSPVNQCRNSASVTANNYAGGITGHGSHIFNCYSMTGAINSTFSGGITGGTIDVQDMMTYMSLVNRIVNCYSSSNVSSGNGILGFTNGHAEILDCVTTSASSSSTLNTNSFLDNTEISVADISVYYGTVNNVSLNSVDGAYSDTVWPNDPYKSLKLTWEVGFDAGSTLPGYGNVLW